MKGSVICASGNDLILVLMHSLNGGKENKLVTNNPVKEMRTIWHHLFLHLPKREGAGGAWHPGLLEVKNTSRKVRKEAAGARANIQTRLPIAAMLPNRASASLEAAGGCELALTSSRGGNSLWALHQASSYFVSPIALSTARPRRRKRVSGQHPHGTVCQDTDTMNTPFTDLLQTPFFNVK